MKKCIESKTAATTVVPSKLGTLLDSGFREVGECIFFKSEFREKNLPDIDFIKNTYTDLSGYEFSMNKIHVEDYCQSDYLNAVLAFIDVFEKSWKDRFKADFFVAVTYDENTDFGEVCTFQFHKKRCGEVVFNIDDIENIAMPVFISESFFFSENHVR